MIEEMDGGDLTRLCLVWNPYVQRARNVVQEEGFDLSSMIQFKGCEERIKKVDCEDLKRVYLFMFVWKARIKEEGEDQDQVAEFNQRVRRLAKQEKLNSSFPSHDIDDVKDEWMIKILQERERVIIQCKLIVALI